MCLWVSYKKKCGKKLFFTSFQSLKKGVGSISQRYGSGGPDPLQNVTDPQNCVLIVSPVFTYGKNSGLGYFHGTLYTVSLTIFRSMKTSTPMSAATGDWRDKTRRPLLTPVGEEEQGLSPVLRAAATSRDAARKSRDQSPAVAAEGYMSPVRRIAAREAVNSDVKSRVHR